MIRDASIPVRDEIRVIAARSEVYKILAAVFIYPNDEQVVEFVLNGAPDALRQVEPFLPYRLNALQALRPYENEVDNLAVEFTGLFDNASGQALVSLHEKDHVRDAPQQIWEDLIRFYEHFGVDYQLGVNNKEWPDWIGMQFEFLHLLTFLEAAADDNRRKVYIAAEADFLERHPARWIPKFSTLLAKKAAGSPYAAYADVLGQFIAAELEFNRGRRPIQAVA